MRKSPADALPASSPGLSLVGLSAREGYANIGPQGSRGTSRIGKKGVEQMTITEAIKVNERILEGDDTVTFQEWEDATRISIEALKRLEANRLDPEFDHWLPLPGETEE